MNVVFENDIMVERQAGFCTLLLFPHVLIPLHNTHASTYLQTIWMNSQGKEKKRKEKDQMKYACISKDIPKYMIRVFFPFSWIGFKLDIEVVVGVIVYLVLM